MATLEFETLSRSEAVSAIQGIRSEFFTVEFVKRTTGEYRKMNCRKGVTKHLAGGPAAYNPNDHDLIWVYSMDAPGYRSIPMEGIISVATSGETLVVTD